MTEPHTLSLFRPLARFALWFWREPRPLVRFWTAFLVLLPLALAVRLVVEWAL